MKEISNEKGIEREGRWGVNLSMLGFYSPFVVVGLVFGFLSDGSSESWLVLFIPVCLILLVVFVLSVHGGAFFTFSDRLFSLFARNEKTGQFTRSKVIFRSYVVGFLSLVGLMLVYFLCQYAVDMIFNSPTLSAYLAIMAIVSWIFVGWFPWYLILRWSEAVEKK